MAPAKATYIRSRITASFQLLAFVNASLTRRVSSGLPTRVSSGQRVGSIVRSPCAGAARQESRALPCQARARRART
eukprot:6093566-Pleurochrysis_carterae.AAC.1